MAFFPCTRFENQIILHFKGNCNQMQNYSLEQKLATELVLHNELNKNYSIITKLVIVCLRKKLKLVIENPYSTQHYLQRYWCIEPKIIDYDRRENGDYYKKPTQYWFINCEPLNQLLFDEAIGFEEKKIVSNTRNQVERSMISPNYARRFIRTYLINKGD